ncbi:caspase family protein [Pontibacter sp. G13]|uniref:caspase family protein n=1 Tax=Pontibacter sp. G13 TaxID=3074898 RepID=UPI0028891498|nr:caspase family protein [Pontibacter sp. G13]WNJ21156.1 caspase family protein [Pontibacter sp. G13]
MKYLLTTSLICCLIYQTARAQFSFTQTYGGTGNEQASYVLETQQGGYLMATNTYSFGAGQSDVWAIRTDQNGHIIWKQLIGSEGQDWVHHVLETRDGNFVFSGYTRTADRSESNAWIFSLDRHGDMMWEHTYGSEEEKDEIRSVIQTRDGGFAAVGYLGTGKKDNPDMWLLRLNAVGDLLWEKSYGGKVPEKANCIVETQDEGFVIGGYQQLDNMYKADMVLFKVNRKGKGIWKEFYRAPGNGSIEAVAEMPNGNLVLGGWAYLDSSHVVNASIQMAQPNGKIIWEATPGGSGKDVVYDISVDERGIITCAGSTQQLESKTDAWVFQLNPGGTLVWETKSARPDHDWVRSIGGTVDGGFVMAGGTRLGGEGGTEVWLVKTDPMGRFIGHEESGEADWTNTNPETPFDPNVDPFKPNLYMLSVGVSNYLNEPVDLFFAHSDAQDIANKWKTMQGSLFGKVEAKVLTNEEATLVNVKKAIGWLEREATQKDLIIMFISSHGALDHKGNLYILPTDFDSDDLFATALNIQDLTGGINGTPSKKLIFLDACHSGQSGFDLMGSAGIKAANLNQAVEELMESEPGVTVVTSSSGKEFSYENPKWGHGAFTMAMLEGLNGAADYNRDQVVKLTELNLYITERVKDLTKGLQHPFMPLNLFGDIPLFILK